MNPFDWPVHDFVYFYFFFWTVVLEVSRRVSTRRESSRGTALPGRLPMDPYEIAYLRGGPRGALAVAMFSLLGRGLLREDAGVLSRAAESSNRLPAIEREVLAFFAQRASADQALRNKTLQAATQDQAASLRLAGLLPDWSERGRLFVVVCALISAVAWIKIYLALSRGQPDIRFLVYQWLAACTFFVLRLLWPRQTPDGQAALSTLQGLFPYEGPLSIAPRETPEEMDMLAAVNGVADVPGRRIASRDPRLQILFGDSGRGASSSSCGGGGGGGGGGCGGCGS